MCESVDATRLMAAYRKAATELRPYAAVVQAHNDEEDPDG